MPCPICRAPNPPAARFCNGCGERFAVGCPQCGNANPSGARFCNECGAALIPSTDELAAAVPFANPAHDGERRQLTVMFADLADSTALSGQLDPEDFRAVVRGYHAACATAVERHGGYVGKWLGDGMLAYFSYPAAHEDDAQRAIRAGLEITSWAGMQAPQGGLPFGVRVGLHTGLCIVGEMGSGERVEHTDVVGETPNVAARVQGAAPANRVAVSTATWRLAQGYFVAESMGAHSLKGIAQPLELFRISGESGAQSRLDVSGQLTPLVGREDEMALIRDRWEKAVAGEGQVVLISGEAGIGKSRLVRALRDHAAGNALRIELHCSQFHQNSALYPLIDHLQRALGSGESQGDERAAAERLATMLDEAGVDTRTSVPLLAALLGLPLPDGYAPLELSPEQQKQRTYEAVLGWLAADARKRPVLVAVEDLHWVDPSTLELLGMMVGGQPSGQMLVLLTFRPEFDSPWTSQPYVASLSLSRLGRNDVDECIRSVAAGRELPREVVDQIVARTDGVPLFVEELTKMVLESGLLREEDGGFVLDGPLPPLAIPETLQDSLMARLDRLAAVKEVAQLGATLGREFSQALIAAVSPLAADALARGLDALVASGLVYRRGFGGTARYVFKHALIQDAAYNSLLRSTRGRFHQRIAEALVARFPDVAEAQPEVVAHHYTEAGLGVMAVAWWKLAGEIARTRGANVEAVAHLSRGLDVLAGLPPGPDRDRQELALVAALMPPLSNVYGYAAPVVAEMSGRALALADGLDDPPEAVSALYGAFAYHLVTGTVETLYWAERTLAAAQKQGNPGPVCMGHYAVCLGKWLHGDLASAEAHARAGWALYDKTKVRENALMFSFDPGVGSLGLLAVVLLIVGRYEESERLALHATDEARQAAQPDTFTTAMTLAAWAAVWRRDALGAMAFGAEAVIGAENGGGQSWLPWGLSHGGWGKIAGGDVASGLADVEAAVAIFDAIGTRFRIESIVAESFFQAGAYDRAEAMALEGIDAGDRGVGAVLLAECHRIRGLCLLQRAEADHEGSEREFLSAVAVAREQGALAFELRAARDLARLWIVQDKHADAHDLLQPVYARFTEGFETPDLVESRELLHELGATGVGP